MQSPTYLKILNNLPAVWWQRIPIRTWRLSRTLSIALADGLYLSAWPKGAAFTPPLAVLSGFLLGWFHFAPGIIIPFGGVETFTYSLVVMALMLIIGILSAGLGVWLMLGYAIGDFFLFNHFGVYRDTFHNVLFRVGVPLLLSYILLATLLIFIPLTSKRLSQITLLRFKVPHKAHLLVVSGVQASIQAALVFIWTQTVPVLIRPVYTWHGANPVNEAIQPLQQRGWTLVVLAILITAARIAIEHRAWMKPEVVQRAALVRAGWIATRSTREPKLPIWGMILLRAAFTTFFLSGILTTWRDAIVLGLVVALILFARHALSNRLRFWFLLISRVPLLIRMAAGALISALLVWQILSVAWKSISNQGIIFGQATFQPVLLSIIVSLIVFSLLLPNQTTLSEEQEISEKRQP